MKAILEINGFQKIIDIPKIEVYIRIYFDSLMTLHRIPWGCNPAEETNIITFVLQDKPIGNFLHYLPKNIV